MKDVLKGYTTLNNGGTREIQCISARIYWRRKGKMTKIVFPYVLVCLDEEVIQEEEGDNICSILLPGRPGLTKTRTGKAILTLQMF